jgi:hypothetical protein
MLYVIALVRKDVTDATARIRHIACISWNQVDVEVENRLAGS